MHILSVQVCILVELYERVRSFVPLVEACASPEAEQAAAPGSHCHGGGGHICKAVPAAGAGAGHALRIWASSFVILPFHN